jgi:hypothetical protein
VANLVVVAGHAVLVRPKNLTADGSWALLDFQRGEPPFYIEHVRTGIALAAGDPESVLMFSGGPTRVEAGPRTEAASYLHVAAHYAWFGTPEVAGRTLLEEFSRDSFENLLFGICRFTEFTGEYPEFVTLVSWKFKERRFDAHRNAIGFPLPRFRFVGPNNPRDLAQALASEDRAVEAYARDPYSSGERFRAKRRERNAFLRQNGYSISCPELAALLAHEGPELFPGPLPW